MAVNQRHPLILASGSAIRQQMLKSVGLTFGVEPSGIDEEELDAKSAHLPIAKRAIALARAKALAVSARQPKAFVIGADQMCLLGEAVMQKPGSFEKAEAQLILLAGKTHEQHCGCVIAKDCEIVWESESSAELTMRALSREEIHAYIAADKPIHACGSYHFESLGRHLFSKVEGDHDVIKGLPLIPLLNILHEFGVISLT